MLLNQVMHFNDLSQKLREELETKIRGFGKSVRYKFDISNKNPAPMNLNDTIIYPNIYTLDPTIFSINDPYEDRKDHQRAKRIAIIDGMDDKGIPNKFKKIRVEGKFKGIFYLDLENNEQFNYAMFLELHPKLKGGKFSDKTKQQIFSRVDEYAMATEQREFRSARKLAMDTAEKMSDAEIVEFADAMVWDSTDEMTTLRNKVEELAEQTPVLFTDLVKDKKTKFQAAVKRAIDKQIWSYDPSQGKLSWASTTQVIAMIGSGDGGIDDYEKLATWFLTAGKNADEAYKKLLGVEGSSVLK